MLTTWIIANSCVQNNDPICAASLIEDAALMWRERLNVYRFLLDVVQGVANATNGAGRVT
jgi:hypothetical protein